MKIIETSLLFEYLKKLQDNLEEAIQGDCNSQDDRDYFSFCMSEYRSVSSMMDILDLFTTEQGKEIRSYRLKVIRRFYHKDLAAE